ncbi:MAG: methyltransferase domain-containing protein [Opitutaceae bacterium]
MKPLPLLIETAFGRHAESYECAACVQTWLADWLAEWLEPAWPPAAEVIEVGAGTGLFTRKLVERGNPVAMDISEAMVRQGRQRVHGARWLRGDALELPPSACDRLYSSAMLQWVADPVQTMRIWSEALRPGGRMLHGIFIDPTLPELGALEPDAVPLRWRTEVEWTDAMRRTGLRVLRSEVRSIETGHPNALAFLRNLHDTGATLSRPMLRAGRLRVLLREYDALHRCADGGVKATWTMLRIEASRA